MNWHKILLCIQSIPEAVIVFDVLVILKKVHLQPVLVSQSALFNKLAHSQAYIYGVTDVCVDASMTIRPNMRIFLNIFIIKKKI